MLKTIYNNIIISYNRLNETNLAKITLQELYKYFNLWIRKLNIQSITESDQSDSENNEESDIEIDNNVNYNEIEQFDSIDDDVFSQVNSVTEDQNNEYQSQLSQSDEIKNDINIDKSILMKLIHQNTIDTPEILQNKIYLL